MQYFFYLKMFQSILAINSNISKSARKEAEKKILKVL